MSKSLAQKVAECRKAIVNAIGLATSLLALGLIPEPEAGWIAGGVAVATAVVHYVVPNDPQKREAEPVASSLVIESPSADMPKHNYPPLAPPSATPPAG